MYRLGSCIKKKKWFFLLHKQQRFYRFQKPAFSLYILRNIDLSGYKQQKNSRANNNWRIRIKNEENLFKKIQWWSDIETRKKNATIIRHLNIFFPFFVGSFYGITKNVASKTTGFLRNGTKKKHFKHTHKEKNKK